MAIANVNIADFLKEGSNITLTTSDEGRIITIASSGGGGGHTIQDEGTPLTQRTNLNFVGSAVTVTDGGAGPDSTIVTISGGSITVGDTQVLFADGANNPAGEAAFTYNKTTNKLTVDEINLNGKTASRFVTTDSSKNLDTPYSFIDDDSMATASATAIPSSESVKAYVDATVVTQSKYSQIQAIWYHLNSF